MDVTFRKRKLGKVFNAETSLKRSYGEPMARAIMLRMGYLRTAPNLAKVPVTPPERRHQLKGNLAGRFAVDLVHPYRLVFEPNHDPLPRKDDGGIDAERVTAVTIIEVIDYH